MKQICVCGILDFKRNRKETISIIELLLCSESISFTKSNLKSNNLSFGFLDAPIRSMPGSNKIDKKHIVGIHRNTYRLLQIHPKHNNIYC